MFRVVLWSSSAAGALAMLVLVPRQWEALWFCFVASIAAYEWAHFIRAGRNDVRPL